MPMCKEVQVLVGLFAVVAERSSTCRLGVIATAPPIAVELPHINGVSSTCKPLCVKRQFATCKQRMTSLENDVTGE